MATLRTFDEKVKTESVAEKRAEIDKKVDERIATDRRKILEEKRALMQKKNEKEKLLGLLQEKQGFGDLVCSFCFALKDFRSLRLVVYVDILSVKLGKTMQQSELDIFGQKLNREFIGNQRLPFQNF